ncbi:JAB domain-containing protein [Fibrella forsythiae]|uniref:JAB domain-containing protein n=1 Tax=Fibrella forsythiae TaxID=2817061 RepID=A0ABS3JKR2_9BACT|nr:JAB domain-containing protein [Fibrella forsythiae]MBO0950603.1 JAB domain-containing protein [Fibrella forsythiae]
MSQLHLQDLFKVDEVEIIYRNRIPYQDRIQITQPATAYEVLRVNWDENRLELVEQFNILMLDQKNTCLAISDLATGGIAACLADPKIIFATALKARAIGIILAHNHPSGNSQASGADLTLTRKLVEGGKLLNINVLDHLIITSHNYTSLADAGLIPR